MRLIPLLILAAVVGADAPKTKGSPSKTNSSARPQPPPPSTANSAKKSTKKSKSTTSDRRKAKRPLSKQAKNDYLRAQSQMKVGSLEPIKLTPRRPYRNSKTYINVRGENVSVLARDPVWGARWELPEPLRADDKGNATNFLELRFRAEADRGYLIDCSVYGGGHPDIQVMVDPCSVGDCKFDAPRETGSATRDGSHLLRYLPPKTKQREVMARLASDRGIAFYGCEITPLEDAN